MWSKTMNIMELKLTKLKFEELLPILTQVSLTDVPIRRVV